MVVLVEMADGLDIKVRTGYLTQMEVWVQLFNHIDLKPLLLSNHIGLSSNRGGLCLRYRYAGKETAFRFIENSLCAES